MALAVNATLIAAQAQAYAPQKRAFAPPPVEKLASGDTRNAVRVELSAEARQAGRVDGDAQRRPERETSREFAREAPLKSAQEKAGTRNVRPGSNLDISI